MTASCPVCGRLDCRVTEVFTQATRYEPMRSLGLQSYCPDCDVNFRVKSEQTQATFLPA